MTNKEYTVTDKVLTYLKQYDIVNTLTNNRKKELTQNVKDYIVLEKIQSACNYYGCLLGSLGGLILHAWFDLQSQDAL